MLVDAYTCTRFDTRETRETLMDFPKEFLVDVMFANAHVFNVVDGLDLRIGMPEVCDYHEHAMEERYRRRCKSRVDKHW